MLEPYTLLVYKKGLYLAGYSQHHQSVRTFSLGTGMLKRVAVAPASFPERSEDESSS